jgi:hypothetical protein
MSFETILNQPILFEEDIQPNKNNDNSAYAQLMQSGDQMCVQLKATPITEDLISPEEVLAEYVTDPNFANVAGDWTLGSGWTDIGGGQVQYVGFPASTLQQTLASSMGLGLPYRCTVIVDELISGVIAVYCGTSLVGKIEEAGTFIFDFTHIGNDNIWMQQDPDNDVTANFTVSEFSIVDYLWSVLNYDFSTNIEVQEQTTNSGFTGSATGWTLSGNVAYSANTIVKTAGATGLIRQTCPDVINRLMHTITINVTALGGGGNIQVIFGNVTLGTITGSGVSTFEYNLPTTLTGAYGVNELVLVCSSALTATITSAKIERNVPQWEYSQGSLCRNTLSSGTDLPIFLNDITLRTNIRFRITNRMQGSIYFVDYNSLETSELCQENGLYSIFMGFNNAQINIEASPDFDGCVSIIEVFGYSNDIEYVIVDTAGVEKTQKYPVTIYNDFLTFCFDLGDVLPVDLDPSCYQVKVIDNDASPVVELTSTTLISYTGTDDIKLSAMIYAKNTGIQDGFYWDGDFIMWQRIRLLRISPTWEISGKDYVYSTGMNVSPSVIKDKVYELFIDRVDEPTFDALAIQLFADDFRINDVPYFSELDNIEPLWATNMSRNLAQLRMKIRKKVSRLFKTL